MAATHALLEFLPHGIGPSPAERGQEQEQGQKREAHERQRTDQQPHERAAAKQVEVAFAHAGHGPPVDEQREDEQHRRGHQKDVVQPFENIVRGHQKQHPEHEAPDAAKSAGAAIVESELIHGWMGVMSDER